MNALVEVSGLCVAAQDDSGVCKTIVRDVGFSIEKGETLALIGESGSGKTTVALALMGYARAACRIAGGEIRVAGIDVAALRPQQLRKFRGSKVTYVAQSAAAAFNPSRTIIDQVVEPALIHGLMARREAEGSAIALFRALALQDPDLIGRRYPHQLSGGQLQRLMAAMALITDPALIILDEPTTALDVTTQIDALRVFKRVVNERGATAVYVSHDLAVVAQMADRIAVLKDGELREIGATRQVLEAPVDPYTQSLLAAARVRPKLRATERSIPLLEITNMTAGYRGKVVLKNIDLGVRRGASLGIIGESGSGKSTLAKVIAGLLPPQSGTLRFDGKALAPSLNGRTRDQLRRIQIVTQHADTALNPAHDIKRILERPLQFYHGLSGAARGRRAAELVDLVRLPSDVLNRRAPELSGGQKQRVALARALAAEPELILCDEITAALDTVVGAAILELIGELRRDLGLSVLFISHDISTVRAVCDDIAVLYAGRKVEEGSRCTFAATPFHPYTELLISSVPEMRPGWLEESHASRALPPIGAPADDPSLCAFLPRCPVRIDGLCNHIAPPRARSAQGKEMLCHRAAAETAA
jgi:peptide/nickel transport system ATP-binding protein